MAQFFWRVLRVEGDSSSSSSMFDDLARPGSFQERIIHGRVYLPLLLFFFFFFIFISVPLARTHSSGIYRFNPHSG